MKAATADRMSVRDAIDTGIERGDCIARKVNTTFSEMDLEKRSKTIMHNIPVEVLQVCYERKQVRKMIPFGDTSVAELRGMQDRHLPRSDSERQ